MLVPRLLLLTIVVAIPALAHAQDPDALIRNGLELRRAGHDQEALPQFQKAIEEKRTPRGLAQLGFCEQALGLWVQAEAHLQEALKSEGDDAWTTKNARQLRDSLAYVKGKIGLVEIWGTPAGASVVVDDNVLGKLPLPAPLHVGEGRHGLRVEAPDYIADTRAIEIRGGTSIREHVALARAFHLEAAGAPPAAAGSGAVPHGEGSVAGRSTPLVDTQSASKPDVAEQNSSAPFYTKWWFWTAVGGVVAAGAVTTFLIVRNNGSSCVPQPGAPCW